MDRNNLEEVCASKLLNDPTVIDGPGFVVESDKSVNATRNYNAYSPVKERGVEGVRAGNQAIPSEDCSVGLGC